MALNRKEIHGLIFEVNYTVLIDPVQCSSIFCDQNQDLYGKEKKLNDFQGPVNELINRGLYEPFAFLYITF